MLVVVISTFHLYATIIIDIGQFHVVILTIRNTKKEA
jgi:hypothetical protein